MVGETTLENLVQEHPEVQIENSFKYEIFKRSSIEEPHWMVAQFEMVSTLVGLS